MTTEEWNDIFPIIPTAEEFFNVENVKKERIDGESLAITTSRLGIEFAKLHREAILKEIADDYMYYLEGDEGSERLYKEKFFKEVYPLNNIK